MAERYKNESRINSEECAKRAGEMAEDKEFCALSHDWLTEATRHKYTFQMEFMGRPILQMPSDMLGVQQIVWETKPDLIIETGIAHGGSLIYSAALLKLLDNGGEVVGIDIDIREHNRKAIEEHPLYPAITMLEGSSVDEEIVKKVRAIAAGHKRVMVLLDSMHTHEHVLAELKAYAPLVSVGCYITVFDTIVEYMPEDFYADRPWAIGNNPATAVKEFLKGNDEFVVDSLLEQKLVLTYAPGGWLKRVK